MQRLNLCHKPLQTPHTARNCAPVRHPPRRVASLRMERMLSYSIALQPFISWTRRTHIHTLIHASTFASSERLLYSCVRVCVAVFMWYRFYYLALTVFVVVNIMCLVVTLPLHTVIWAVMFLLLLASFANFSAFHVQRRWSSWIFHHSFRPPSTRFTSFLPLSCGFAACRFSCLLLCLCLFL